VTMLLTGVRGRLAPSRRVRAPAAGLLGAIDARALAPRGYSPALSARLAVVVASNLGVWAAAQAWGGGALRREWITVGRCVRPGRLGADRQPCALTHPYVVAGDRTIVPGATGCKAPWTTVDGLCRCAERYLPAPPWPDIVCDLPTASWPRLGSRPRRPRRLRIRCVPPRCAC
jgi:hypothetical protein